MTDTRMKPSRIAAARPGRRPMRRARRIDQFYPDTGPYRREFYPKHVACLNDGRIIRERLFMAANRVGKTEGIGGYETTLHLTGDYPHWWEGRRFDRPVRVLVAGETAKTTRDVIQRKLLGPPGAEGTGLIPAEALVRRSAKAGTAEAADQVRVRHVSGGVSRLVFRSFEQGPAAFKGDEFDFVWLDEEPPLAVYIEAVMRTMTTNGCVLMTFTPLKGYTDLVRLFTDTPEAPLPAG